MTTFFQIAKNVIGHLFIPALCMKTILKYRKGFSFYCLLFLFTCFIGCSKQQKVEIGTIQDVNIYNMNEKNVTLGLELPIKNKRSLNVKVIDINLKAELDDSYLGTVHNVDTIKVQRKSNQLHDIKLRLQFPGLFGALNAMEVMNKEGGKLHLSGGITLRYLLVFSKTISINETQYINFSRY